MPRQRLLNCDFINSGSFKVNTSNKAKLLYLLMITNADDKGFVDTTNDIINSLEQNDTEMNENQVNLTLLGNDYKSALQELIDKGYLYVFEDKHNNKVHLIRHWFFHNKYKDKLWTNYMYFLSKVFLDNNEYKFGKKPLKEDKLKENKVNEIKLNESKGKDTPKQKELTKEEYDKLSPEEQQKYLDSLDISDDLPY